MLDSEDSVDDLGSYTGLNCELFYACKNGKVELVRSLLEKGANVRCMDKDGWTAIHFCCACEGFFLGIS